MHQGKVHCVITMHYLKFDNKIVTLHPLLCTRSCELQLHSQKLWPHNLKCVEELKE